MNAVLTPKLMLELRLLNQMVVGGPGRDPHEVVSRLGAVQAQDYLDSLWSVGLRLNDARQIIIEKAIVNRDIVRTWPMRGTLHFVAAEDARWMIDLLAPRVASRNAGRLRRIGITKEAISQSRKLLVKMLQGKESLTRA